MPDPSPHQPNFSTHPLVTKLRGDSDTPPSLVALTGYFGPSKKADSIRLYPSLDFQSYFEIPKAAIVATTPVDAEDADSPTVVYVKAGTPVDSVQTSTQPVESYLQGGITGGYLGAIAPLAMPYPSKYCTTICSFYCTFEHCRPTPMVAAQVTHPPCSGVHTQCCPAAEAGIHTAPYASVNPCCPLSFYCPPPHHTPITVCGCQHPQAVAQAAMPAGRHAPRTQTLACKGTIPPPPTHGCTVACHPSIQLC
jgi:hypothetical protein